MMRKATFLAAVVVGLATTAARANTAYIKYISPGPCCDVAGFRVDFNNDGSWDKQYNDNVYTGEYKFAFDASNSSAEAGLLLDDPFYAYCIDVAQNAPTHWALYDITDLENAPVNGWNVLMGATRADRVRELFGRFIGDVNTKEEGEAFAASLWEIVYEKSGAYHLDDGTLIMNGLDGNAKSISEDWLGQLNGDTGHFDYDVFALTNPCYQDFALTSPGYGGQPIPEPVTMMGMVLGVGGLAAYLRKRRPRTDRPGKRGITQ